jgi:membrane protease subunit HflK
MVKNPWEDDQDNQKEEKQSEKKEEKNDNIKQMNFNQFKGSKFFKKAKDKIGSKFLKSPVKFTVLIILSLWLISGLYIVDNGEQAVILRFGEYVRTSEEGLHYHLPFPIESAMIKKVTQEHRIEIGYKTSGDDTIDVPSEGVMLTGDENVVKADFTIIWNIKDLKEYFFNIKDQEYTIKIVAESVIREIVGQNSLLDVLIEKRDQIESQTKQSLQELMDKYEGGVQIRSVQLLSVEPPKPVIDSFNDIQRARLEKESMINKAEAYMNERVPYARGEAEKIIKNAEAYKAKTVNAATGDVSRFKEVLSQYRISRKVTEDKIYIDTMKELMKNTDLLIMDKNVGGNALPYLNIDKAR